MRRSSPLRELKRFFSILSDSIAQGFGTIKFIALAAATLLTVSALVAGVALAIDSVADEGPADSLSQTSPADFTTAASEKTVSIRIVADGGEWEISAPPGTVAQALIHAGFDPGEDDMTAPSRDTAIYDGMTVTLMRTAYETFEYLVDIPYETEYVDDKTMYKGDTKTVTAGVLGKREIVIKKTMVDGLMFESETVSATVVSEPVTMVVKRGTKAKPVATTKPKTTTTEKPVTVAPGEEYITIDGKKYKVEKKIQGQAVAYYSKKETPITATGNVAIPWKTVAVDPKVIPYGSIVYVAPMKGSAWSYGPANAHDTGVKGNTVDLFMETYEQCIQHGRRDVYIYIIKPVS